MVQLRTARRVLFGMNASRPSFGSMFLTYGGGLTGLYGAIGAYSAISGTKFEFGGGGSGGGVPLASSWPAVATLLIAAVGLYALGRSWDRPAFAALRQRRRWLVPVVVTFVVVPALLVLIFMLVQ